MNTSASCHACRTTIPADAPGGLCPVCALAGAVSPTLPAHPDGIAPDVAEVAAAFPHLEIISLIGQGGMGVVFKVRQPGLDRLAALKLLPPHLAARPGFAERFTREARALARLHHPHIVAVYDFGQSGGWCHLLMEFVDGVTLREAMRAGITPEQALLLVPRLCEALQYAHDNGVLHRDIKPENILLDRAGSPRLADFGIAKLSDEAAASLTMSGAALGTAAYMAPEQIENPGSVDHRADIYSLGVVFYEMLTGELPLGRFAAPSHKAAVGERLDAVVLRALEKEREHRQQSAGEMRTQVEDVRDDTRPEACHDDPTPPRIARILAILTGAAGLAAAILGILFDGHAGLAAACAGAAAILGIVALQWRLPLRFNAPANWVPAPGVRWQRRSPHQLFGLPLYHIVRGPDPATGRLPRARGVLAVGPEASGFLAIGGRASGVIAIGGIAVGVVAIGGMAAGLLVFGGITVGFLAAAGGFAAAPFAIGGFAGGIAIIAGSGVGHEGIAARLLAGTLAPPREWAVLLGSLAVLGLVLTSAAAAVTTILALGKAGRQPSRRTLILTVPLVILALIGLNRCLGARSAPVAAPVTPNSSASTR